ncbi:MAG: MucBP domain-containing protein [Clostridia bacterium]|nr:MucBP domain-containing protein [Clostridia bacterium]
MKNAKRALSLLLSFLLVLGACAAGITVSAEDPVYEIDSYTKLKEFASLVNGGQTGLNAKLTADITATDKKWVPIGNVNNKYTGTFDGGGHSVKNLSNTELSDEIYRNGLFGIIGSSDEGKPDGKVMNVGVVNADFIKTHESGGIAGENHGTVENCFVSGLLSISGIYDAGGVVGDNHGTVSYCYNSGSGSITSVSNAGGVAGDNAGGTVSDCYNSGSGSISGNDAGGVVGQNDGTVSNCYNSGSGSISGDNAGGVAGCNHGTVSDCYNSGSGSITGGEYSDVGGVVGYNARGTVSDCYNSGSGSISGKLAGGVIGYNTGTVSDCYNSGSGDISGDKAGGVIGYNYGTVSDCYNSGSGSISGVNAGGVVGNNYEGTVVNSFYCSEINSIGTCIGTNNGTSSNVSGLSKDDFKNPAKFGGTAVETDDGVIDYPGFFTETDDGEYVSDVWVMGPERPLLVRKISNYSDLMFFAGMVNNGENGTCAVLTADIDASASDPYADGFNEANAWTPIGIDYDYTGTFDGMDSDGVVHTITGLTIRPGYNLSAGLFFGVGLGGTVQNVIITDGNCYSRLTAGGIATFNSGTISNCCFSGSVTSSGSTAGGIAGENYGTVTACRNTGSVSANNNAGGIAGLTVGDSANIEYCENSGKVSGESNTGGISGRSLLGTIKNCVNSGIIKVKYNNGSNYAGGITGSGTSTTIINCRNTGIITDSYNSNYIGGIAGAVDSRSIIKNCSNTEYIEGNQYVGGIAGSSNNYTEIISCFNTGNIGGRESVGGIAGTLSLSSSVNNCFNTGAVNSRNAKQGGIAGVLQEQSKINNCYSAGCLDNTGSNYSGAIAGYSDSSMEITNCYYDRAACGTDKGAGNITSAPGIKALPTAQMTGENALDNMQFVFEEGEENPWMVKAGLTEGDNYYWFYPALKGFDYAKDGARVSVTEADEACVQMEADAILAADWPAKITVTVNTSDISGLTYKGADQTPEILSVTAGDIVPENANGAYYSRYTDGNWAGVTGTPEDPGVYKIESEYYFDEIEVVVGYKTWIFTIIDGDDCSFTIQKKTDSGWSDVDSAVDAGDYKMVITFDGDAYGNDFPAAETEFSISPAGLTITAKDQTYPYNGSEQGEDNTVYTADFDSKVKVNGLVGDDKLTGITLDGAEKGIGVYEGRIIPSAAVIGEKTANYDINYVAGKLTIESVDCPLTINYVYAEGGEASETHEEDVEIFTSYSVTSPEITGYTPDPAKVEGTMGDADINGKTVKVTYTANTYTATLMVDGKAYNEISFTYGQKSITLPAVPEKEGHTGEWENYSLIADNIKINAIYTVNEYNLVYLVDGGEFYSTKVAFGDPVIHPRTPVREGYDFAWDNEIPEKMPANDLTFNAVYTPIKYTATFVDENGDLVDTREYTVESKSIDEPAVPGKEGYDGKWEEYEFTAGGITVKPVYTPADICPLDKEYHGDSFWGRLVTFFHTFIWKAFRLIGLDVYFSIKRG